MTDPPERLSASQISLILQRAAEIDASGDTLSVEELTRIAAEAGIDPGATSVAIQEVLSDETPAPLPVTAPAPAAQLPAIVPKSTIPSPWRIILGGAVGVGFGFLGALATDMAWPWLGFGAVIIYLLLRMIQAMKKGRQLDFHLQNFATWFGAWVGAAASDMLEHPDDDFFGVIFVAWLLTSILGALFVHLGPRDREPADDSSGAGPYDRR